MFQPEAGENLIINGLTYSIAAHPAAQGMPTPYGQEGRQAVVYQIISDPSNDGESELLALKVMKPLFRVPALVGLSKRIAPYASFPGLRVCSRKVFTPQQQPDLLRQHPDLTYSVLMPWIEGPTWMEVTLSRQVLTPEQSLTLARSFAN